MRYNIYDNICSYVNLGESLHKNPVRWPVLLHFLQLRRYDLNRKSYLLKVPSEQLLLFLFNNIVLLYKNKSSMVKVRVRG